VAKHKAAFRTHALYKAATGYAAAYPLLDAAAGELAKLRNECAHFAKLGSVLELADAVAPITAAIGEAFEDLAAVKDVWDCSMMCEVQLKVRVACEDARRRRAQCSRQPEQVRCLLLWGVQPLTRRPGRLKRRPGARRCGATSTPRGWRRGPRTLSRRSRRCPKR
jgi:hypothetical protein